MHECDYVRIDIVFKHLHRPIDLMIHKMGTPCIAEPGISNIYNNFARLNRNLRERRHAAEWCSIELRFQLTNFFVKRISSEEDNGKVAAVTKTYSRSDIDQWVTSFEPLMRH